MDDLKDTEMSPNLNVSPVPQLDLQSTFSSVMNHSYYSIFLPITLVGNTLSIAVVAVIVHHKRNRRNIADLLLGALALLDLLSLFTVHAVSMVCITKGDHHMPKGLTVFQAFSASIYMKLQFLIQICISLDRYLALVRPLQYNIRFTSRKVMFMVSSILIIVTSSSSIILATTCPPQIEVLPTWPMSLFRWSFKCVPHAVVAVLTCLIFAVGIIVFMCCNINLVRILWQYHSQREKINEFSHVVNVLEKKVSQHLQASQSTLHKIKMHPRLNESRSNSLRPPEVHVQVSSGSKEDEKTSTNNGNCNGDVNGDISYKRQTSIEKYTPSLHTNRSLSSDTYNKSEERSFHSTKEHHDLAQNNEVVNPKVSRTMNVNNLKIVVNIEEPTTSPEVGTPDSQCNLIEEELHRKLSVDNNNKLTPETPEIRIEGPFEDENDKEGETANEEILHCHGNIDVINKYGLVPNSPNISEEKSIGSRSNSLQRPKTLCTLEVHSPKPKKSVSFSSIILEACPQPEERNNDDRSPISYPSSTITKNDTTLMTNLTDYFHKVLKSWGKKTEKQRREVLLARLVAVCSSIYLATWIPYTVTALLSISGRPTSPIVTDVSLRLIFANAALNPIFYGLCRRTYRKGYQYISLFLLHYLFCGLVPKPGEDKIFFESKTKKVKRHLAAADMNMHLRVRRQRRRAMSAHALQILQQLRQAVSPVGDKMSHITDGFEDFQPSSRLQSLFQQCMDLEMSDSESSSYNYDHLLFTDSVNEDFIQNLKEIWSLYDLENTQHNENNEDDLDLDFNYDDIISSDHALDEVFYGLNENHGRQLHAATSLIEEIPNNHSDIKQRNSSL